MYVKPRGFGVAVNADIHLSELSSRASFLPCRAILSLRQGLELSEELSRVPKPCDHRHIFTKAKVKPEQTASLKDEIQNIFRIINALPKRQRKTILMHRIDGMSYKEIAEKLNVSVSSVEKHMSKVLKSIHLAYYCDVPPPSDHRDLNDSKRNAIHS